MRSFVRLIQVNPGFQPANVVTADALMAEDRYPGKPEMLAFYRNALARVRSLPGVESAGMITHLPFGGNDWGNGYEVEGQSVREPNAVAQIRPVSPGYFSTLGIPLRSGVDFSERDNENAAGVAIVSELLARRSWPNDNPIGKKIRYGDDWLTVIGVCGDIKHGTLDESSVSMIYVPYPQVPAEVAQFVARDLNFVVRSSSPGAVATGLRGAIHALDPGMVVTVNTPRIADSRFHHPTAFSHLADRYFLHPRAQSGLPRHLRRYRLPRHAALKGNRHPPRTGRDPRQHPRAGFGTNLPARAGRHCRRAAGRLFSRAFPRYDSLRDYRA